RDRPRDPDAGREPALLGGARFLRAWHRPHLPRRALDPALRRARGRAPPEARHVLHGRAHGERWTVRGENPLGRLDRRHQGPLALGTVRAHRRRHRDGLRDLYPLPQRLDAAALPLGARGNGFLESEEPGTLADSWLLTPPSPRISGSGTTVRP